MADKHPGIGVLCWHIHHGQLLESSTEPLAERAKYIRENKPVHEVETRLRLMRPVKGPLPKAVADYSKALEAHYEARVTHRKAIDAYYEARDAKTKDACIKAEDAYDKAKKVYRETWVVYGKALGSHRDEIEALHAKECPNCPWDGNTIFPAAKSEEV